MSREAIFLGVAIVGLSCLGVLSILMVAFFEPHHVDHDATIFQIVSVITPTLIALVGAFKSIETKKEVGDLKSTVETNKDHLEKQTVQVCELKNQVKDVKETASVAAKTAVILADKVDKLNGA